MSVPVDIEAGIPQGSPVSPILFLIYISELFKDNHSPEVRLISYLDDIGLVVSSATVQQNSHMLSVMPYVQPS